MALATQCPNCQTRFRVQPEHLKTGGGMVRCGVCRHVFNSLDHLAHVALEGDSDEASSPTLSPPVSSAAAIAAAGAESRPAIVQPSASPGPRSQPPQTPAATPKAPVAAPTAAIQSEILALLDDPPPATTPPRRHVLEMPAAATSAQAQRQEPRLPAAVVSTPPQAERVPVPPTEPAIASHEPEIPDPVTLMPAAQAEPDPMPSATTFAPSHIAGVEEADSRVEPAFLLAFERQARWRRWIGWLSAGGALLALLALVAQVAYVWRADLAVRLPSLRPALQTACEAISPYWPCRLDWPQHIEQLRITSSDLQPESKARDIFSLQFAMENQSAWPLALPHVELTLTDVQNQPVVRRVFAPNEYLLVQDGQKLASLTGETSGAIPGRAELNAKVLFDASQAASYKAAGYLLYIFYP
ncbi:DUF3426 domain-containing protein [Parvibium lacunae]|uniref:DUF3426 domain-containing protein n=1 Tax=Parvibium lacunae TaxID=1888893 RepID=A0A368L389_9BURK|nr:DUF3426 domain-containing protein [Parvibium lacunae]RCS57578.1 DUF3426 domain-containing protein [Parvibium lacunae]